MNSFDDQSADRPGLTDLLFAASQDAPPSRVDLAAVVSDGRRRRRRRAVAVPMLVAAVVLGIVAGGLAVVSLRPTSLQPVPPASNGPTTPPTSTTPAVPTAFPLDRQLFAHDALGELRSLSLALGAQHLGYGGPSVWAFAKGADDARQTVEQGYDRLDAPPVNDLPASYLYADRGSGPQLLGIAFQWAPGAWADILLDDTTSEAELRQLAGGLRADVDEPVLFWFTVSPPPGLRLATAEPRNVGEESHWLMLYFTLGAGPLPALPSDDAAGIEVVVGEYFDGPVEPNATVGGRPAIVADGPESYSVELIDNDGFTVNSVKVVVRGSAKDAFSTQQADALALSVVLLGGWNDLSLWTDDPIR